LFVFAIPWHGGLVVEEVGDLVVRASGGDAGAWSDLVGRFAGLIWSVARSVGLNEADAADVSQTTWLRFSEHLDDLHDRARAASWLATTARREAIRVARLEARQVLVDPWGWLERPEPAAAELDAQLLAGERDVMVQGVVAALPERCRRLLLAAVADPPPSYRDISDRLGMPVGSIGPLRARCLRELGRIIEQLERDQTSASPVSQAHSARLRGSYE
jgi:RNA polymerase sigma factor (sigma-70 family)